MKTRFKIVILAIIIATIIIGSYQYLMFQCGTLAVFMETPRTPNFWKCLEIWQNTSN